jgi:hypothetical protein
MIILIVVAKQSSGVAVEEEKGEEGIVGVMNYWEVLYLKYFCAD